MQIQFQPLGDRVVIKLDAQDEKVGNIIAPVMTQKKEKPRSGEVLKCGPDVPDGAGLVGKKVVFSKYAGTELLIEGMECLIVRHSATRSEIIGVL